MSGAFAGGYLLGILIMFGVCVTVSLVMLIYENEGDLSKIYDAETMDLELTNEGDLNKKESKNE